MTSPEPPRPPLAVAFEWVSKITTVALEMIVPAILGHWLDSKLGTGWVLLVLGSILGMAVAMMHLLRLVRPPEK